MKVMTFNMYLKCLAAGFLCSLCMSSCNKEPNDGSPAGEMTSVMLGATRSFSSENPDDNIYSLRIMTFDPLTGAIIDNRLYQGTELTDPEGGRFIHKMKPGTYDFAFVANEPLAMGADKVHAALNRTAALSDLNGIYIQAADIVSNKNIPMAARASNVEVLPEDGGIKVGGAAVQIPWTVEFKRLAVRIDLEFSAEYDLSAGFNGVTFSNIVDKVPLMGPDYTGTYTTSADRTIAKTSFTALAPLPEGRVWGVKSYNAANLSLRILVPAYEFSTVNQPSKGLKITVDVGLGNSNPFSVLGSKSNDYSLPRNNHYRIRGNVKDHSIEMYENIVPWEDRTSDHVLN